MARGGRYAAEARAIAEAAITGIDVELIDVRFVFENGNHVLQLIIDRRGGVGMDHCVAVSEAVDPRLDEEFSWTRPYQLVVQSPGIDRPLTTAADFARHQGERVEIAFYRAREGRKRIEGELLAGDETAVRLGLDDGSEVTYPRDEISVVRRVVVF
ncbi:MAG: ribosome maturation factor RimP [Bacillota bacterium]|nr:ribosome maturation factor RimP [Bacillota bacterium]